MKTDGAIVKGLQAMGAVVDVLLGGHYLVREETFIGEKIIDNYLRRTKVI